MAIMSALNFSSLQKSIPDSQNMFSVLAHHPASSIRVETTDPLPPTMPRDYHDRQAMKQAADEHDYAAADPMGRDRYKYRAKALATVTSGSLEQQQRMAFTQVKFVEWKDTAPNAAQSTANEPKTKTVFVQTDYRYARRYHFIS